MAKCTFCARVLAPGTGLLYILKDGKTNYFCSKKCEKNKLKLKRKPLKTKWSGYSRGG